MGDGLVVGTTVNDVPRSSAAKRAALSCAAPGGVVALFAAAGGADVPESALCPDVPLEQPPAAPAMRSASANAVIRRLLSGARLWLRWWWRGAAARMSAVRSRGTFAPFRKGRSQDCQVLATVPATGPICTSANPIGSSGGRPMRTSRVSQSAAAEPFESGVASREVQAVDRGTILSHGCEGHRALRSQDQLTSSPT